MKTLSIAISVFLTTAWVCQTQEGSQDWWKNAVFYQVYPRSFKDSDNSGVGDLRGIINNIDHFVDANVTAIWLSPIYKSPQVDHGYDISDFRAIDPLFGTMDDFLELVASCKARGLKLILDFVPNHSSNLHEWFVKSEKREPGYENYYVWLDGREGNTKPPNNWISYFHGSAWTFSKVRQQWYLRQFTAGQPDLNYREPLLVQEMKDVLTFWLDLGVDGFRVDIISALFEANTFADEPLSGNPNAKEDDNGYLNHTYTNNQPETYDMVYQWRSLLDNYTTVHGGDARVMMTESYAEDQYLFPFYGNATHNGAHFSFNFWFITKLNRQSTAWDIKNTIEQWFRDMPSRYTANWVLGNHDVARTATRYGPQRVDGLNMVALLLPGVTVTYQGEEIGMENGQVTWQQGRDPRGCSGRPEDFDKNSRDPQRTPYHWNCSINAGFNIGAESWLPVSKKYLTNNLAHQKVTEKSHFNVYKKLVQLKKSETIKRGNYATVVFNENLFCLVRSLIGHPSYIVLTNIRDGTQTVDLSKIADLPAQLTVKVASVESNRVEGKIFQTSSVSLGPFEAIVLSTEHL